ncbi:cytochrome b N-terminal domain-containing protein [Candidatus Comchoanobacter bicostacola]|uniref:Cytochrome b n=2 Tax=Candidatus Comchoanobacter bicostacola TaxID=2919598 RepID=A0ABY5DN44_9GAMM|nr:cytochrome b N-terminal domain-containing protein [Candidatus Comchoanobacter bicostacola]
MYDLLDHLKHYQAPKNLNFWYFFGALSLLVLGNQLLTGIWLLMYYTPTAADAMASIEFMMREVNFGWLFRYLHAAGASFFFVVVYLHMYRALLYGSYKAPREILWLSGCVMLLLLMAEAYTGYVLPWGQMSYWAARVITSLFKTIPVIGEPLVLLIQGDYEVSEVTLHRFFSFHVVLFPLIILGFVFFHTLCLHAVGSNNPDGIEIKDNLDAQGKPKDGVSFHPFYTVKDVMGVGIFLFIFLSVVFLAPRGWGLVLEPENFEIANPMVTPLHIKPSWYLAPYYAILRAVPDKSLGAIAMFASLLMFFLLPWLDRSPVRSMRYKGPLSRITLGLFTVSFLGLLIVGCLPATYWATFSARIFAILYFSFFFLMPIYSYYDWHKVPPSRLTI